MRRPGVGLALVYHRLGPRPGDPRHELMPAVSRADFAEQVAHVARHYRSVTACDLPRAARERRRGHRLPVAITFDDDLSTHLGIAADVLERARCRGTFFLTGATLDGPRPFWWERLQAVADRGRLARVSVPGLPGHVNHGEASLPRVARAIEALSPRDRDRVDVALAALGPEPAEQGLRRSQVAELARRGFEIGFHTRDHHPLPTLADPELAGALCSGRTELEEAAGAPIRSLAYPNGATDHRTAAAARRAGFTCAFTTSGEPMRRGSDTCLLGRFEPRSASLGVFALKLASASLRRAPADPC